MMRTNPEKYRELRSKQQEATMALYKEHGVNPAAGCAPLIAQLPIFIALFNVLRSQLPESASFYFISDLTMAAPQLKGVELVGAILLIGLMGGTTFLSSRQMTASTAATPEQAQQQKIMMYVMPVVLIPLSWSIPTGVLVYWVTTNLWTLGQQYVMFRSPPVGPASGPPAKAKAAK
jgi:YidC/Oxa1 family membrane protein insertase